jgi:hypothetical protein
MGAPSMGPAALAGERLSSGALIVAWLVLVTVIAWLSASALVEGVTTGLLSGFGSSKLSGEL